MKKFLTAVLLALATAAAYGQAGTPLYWDAPTSSSDPVASYNIYRSLSGVEAFQQIGNVPVAQTNYVDSTATLGVMYDYIVESVDAKGTTSAPSNTLTVVAAPITSFVITQPTGFAGQVKAP